MVFIDLSSSEKINSNSDFSSRLASPADRLLSFFIDFLLISPVAALFSAGALRELKENLIENASNQTLLSNILIYLVIFFTVNWILQVFFLHFWNGSPGQKFLNLRVIQFPQEGSQSSLSFVQCLIRVSGPWLSFVLLGIPMLEVFSHPWRRTFYDRLSDTLVITLKKHGEKAPLAFEANFIRQWMQVTSCLLLLVGIFQLAQIFSDGTDSIAKIKGKVVSGCVEVNLFSNQKFSRLDRALALYIVDTEEKSCLEKELSQEKIFTKEPARAYFAKSLVEKDKELREEYQKQACEVAPDSSECAWIKNPNLAQTSDSLSLQILSAQKAVEAGNWSLALEKLDPLLDENMLFDGLQKSYIKTYFSLTGQDAKSQRSPASDSLSKMTEKFKKRYGVK